MLLFSFEREGLIDQIGTVRAKAGNVPDALCQSLRGFEHRMEIVFFDEFGGAIFQDFRMHIPGFESGFHSPCPCPRSGEG